MPYRISLYSIFVKSFLSFFVNSILTKNYFYVKKNNKTTLNNGLIFVVIKVK